jgi:hypothetical protein
MWFRLPLRHTVVPVAVAAHTLCSRQRYTAPGTHLWKRYVPRLTETPDLDTCGGASDTASGLGGFDLRQVPLPYTAAPGSRMLRQPLRTCRHCHTACKRTVSQMAAVFNRQANAGPPRRRPARHFAWVAMSERRCGLSRRPQQRTAGRHSHPNITRLAPT